MVTKGERGGRSAGHLESVCVCVYVRVCVITQDELYFTCDKVTITCDGTF